MQRIYYAPSPDFLTINVKLSNDYQKRIPEDVAAFAKVYINENESFTSHDCVINKTNNSCYFNIRTVYFIYKKQEFIFKKCF